MKNKFSLIKHENEGSMYYLEAASGDKKWVSLFQMIIKGYIFAFRIKGDWNIFANADFYPNVSFIAKSLKSLKN